MDIFVPNDKLENFLFHNKGGGKFEEVAFEANAALREDAEVISGMGLDFRDIDNDGYPGHRLRRARRGDLSRSCGIQEKETSRTSHERAA